MSYYCHECGERRGIVWNPMATCTLCGCTLIDAIPSISEDDSAEEELEEFFSEMDVFYTRLRREHEGNNQEAAAAAATTVAEEGEIENDDDDDDDDEEEEEEEELLEERCLFEQMSSFYNHPILRGHSSSSNRIIPTSLLSPILTYRPVTPTSLSREPLLDTDEEEEEEEERGEEEEDYVDDIVAYNVRLHQRIMDGANQPHGHSGWESLTDPFDNDAASRIQLPFARVERILDIMNGYPSDEDSDEEVELRSFLDNVAEMLSDYTSEAHQQRNAVSSDKVDEIIKNLKKSYLDPADADIEDECIICQEAYGILIEIYHLPCLHKYHSHCISKWLTVNTSCPICRHPADQHDNTAADQEQEDNNNNNNNNNGEQEDNEALIDTISGVFGVTLNDTTTPPILLQEDRPPYYSPNNRLSSTLFDFRGLFSEEDWTNATSSMDEVD